MFVTDPALLVAKLAGPLQRGSIAIFHEYAQYTPGASPRGCLLRKSLFEESPRAGESMAATPMLRCGSPRFSFKMVLAFAPLRR